MSGLTDKLKEAKALGEKLEKSTALWELVESLGYTPTSSLTVQWASTPRCLPDIQIHATIRAGGREIFYLKQSEVPRILWTYPPCGSRDTQRRRLNSPTEHKARRREIATEHTVLRSNNERRKL